MENEALIELGEHIVSSLEQEVSGFHISYGELTVEARADQIVSVLNFMKRDATCNFSTLIDLCGVDYPARSQRFDVVYHLLSLHQNQRVRVKVSTDEETQVPSVVEVYAAANWYEREAFDLYGILFSDHPDLRRLLTDYGFDGHPLRKDFPLTGHVELRYDDELKRVVYEPVSLTQEFRTFDFMSPWEGADYILQGDEKADDTGKES